MTDHAIGSRISLVSKAEICYEGYLHFINPEENTVGLKDVRMLGTQGRRGGVGEVEANSNVYDFIIFRGGDIKDLTVFDDNAPAPQQNNAIDDPAIMSSGKPSAAAAGSFADRARAPAPQQQISRREDRREDRRSDFGTTRQVGAPSANTGGFWDRRDERSDRFPRRDDRFDNNRRSNYGGGNTGGFERRDNNGYGGGYGGRGGRIGGYEGGRGGGRGSYDNRRSYDDAPRQEYHTGRDFEVATADKKERMEEFDFAKANAEFEKHKAEFEKAKEDIARANAGRSVYDNKSSFFDNISNEAKDRKSGNPFGRLDRDEQRRADVQTFGQEAVGNMRGFRRGRGGRGRFGRN